MNTEFKVSVWMITYAHELYIRKAIDSVLDQKTNFRYELVIGEDFGSDKTRKICEEYASKYPDKINLLPSDKNYGIIGNMIRVLKACTGDYIAFCEGDDYWSDPFKLQKQLNCLDSNKDCTICLTRFDILDNGLITSTLPKINSFPRKFNLGDFLVTLNYRMVSMMIRREVLPSNYPLECFNMPMGDNLLMLWALSQGNGIYLSDSTAVYRVEGQGNWATLKQSNSWKKVKIARSKYSKIIDISKFNQDYELGNKIINFYLTESLQQEGLYSEAKNNAPFHYTSLIKNSIMKLSLRRILLVTVGLHLPILHQVLYKVKKVVS